MLDYSKVNSEAYHCILFMWDWFRLKYVEMVMRWFRISDTCWGEPWCWKEHPPFTRFFLKCNSLDCFLTDVVCMQNVESSESLVLTFFVHFSGINRQWK
jgi:hypothetical protein